MSQPIAMTILSIDDSKSVHAFLDRCVRESPDCGFQFVHAMGVKEGLNVLAQGTQRIAAVLLDWEMPEITGIEGLPMIRAAHPAIPVIILTSKNDPDDIGQMLEKGAADYMMKPITPDILFEKLRSITESTRE